jgi:hypothetical protein
MWKGIEHALEACHRRKLILCRILKGCAKHYTASRVDDVLNSIGPFRAKKCTR